MAIPLRYAPCISSWNPYSTQLFILSVSSMSSSARATSWPSLLKPHGFAPVGIMATVTSAELVSRLMIPTAPPATPSNGSSPSNWSGSASANSSVKASAFSASVIALAGASTAWSPCQIGK